MSWMNENSVDLRMRKLDGDFFCRAAVLIISHCGGKLLAVHNKNFPDLYYTVGGAIGINETSREAARREAFEEIGAEMGIGRLAFVNERFMTVDGVKCHEIVFYYMAQVAASFDMQDGRPTDQGDVETLHWLPLANLEKFNLVPSWLKTKQLNSETELEHIVSIEN